MNNSKLVGDSLKKLYPVGDKEAGAGAVQRRCAGRVYRRFAAAGGGHGSCHRRCSNLEASLEDAEFDHPKQAERVRRLAHRITSVQAGAEPDPLEAWMEELYRRVSDRQTMGSVVQELRGALTESEKAIDAYFRKPAARDQLHPVPGQLNAMRGVSFGARPGPCVACRGAYA